MNALSVQQPWAELIVRGVKMIENRSWPTKRRGPIIIHAGKGRALVSRMAGTPLPGGLRAEELVFGALIGEVDVIDCVSIADLPGALHRNGLPPEQVEWAIGPWCWLLKPRRRYDPPAPAKGGLSLFDCATRVRGSGPPERAQGSGDSWKESAADADKIIEAFRNAGHIVAGSSRLRRYAAHLHYFANWGSEGVLPPERRLRLIAQAAHEIHELSLITTRFASELNTPAVSRRLRWLVDDSELPSQDVRNSPGRDYQFELYIAAGFRGSGFRVTFAEPDVIIQRQGCRVAIAAKRPKSVEKLIRHVRKASRQIVQARLPGIIFLDIERAINPRSEYVPEPDPSGYQAWTTGLFDDFWSEWLDRLCANVDADYVFGFCAIARSPSESWDGFTSLHAISWRYVHTSQQPRHMLLNHVSQAFARGFEAA